MHRPRHEQPRPHDYCHRGDEREQAHPHPAGHPGQPRQLVGVRPPRPPAPQVAPTGPGQLDHRPQPTQQQEPRHPVAEQILYQGRRVRGHPEDGAPSHERHKDPVRVAHRQERREQQHEERPQQQRHVVRGQQHRRPGAEQWRRHVPRERGQHHPGPGSPAPGHRLARRVGMQPDSLKPPPAQHGDQRVPALMRDRDRVPRQVPAPHVEHDRQRHEPAHRHHPRRRHRLGPGEPFPQQRHTDRLGAPDGVRLFDGFFQRYSERTRPTRRRPLPFCRLLPHRDAAVPRPLGQLVAEVRALRVA